MTDRYILVGQTPIPCEDLMEWARWFETEDRRVMYTRLMGGLCDVSTVFLGLDHSFFGGDPQLFETMVFWLPDIFRNGAQMERCSTWSQAEAMHALMVQRASQPSVILASLWQVLRDEVRNLLYGWKIDWKVMLGIPLTDFERLLQSIDTSRRSKVMLGIPLTDFERLLQSIDTSRRSE